MRNLTILTALPLLLALAACDQRPPTCQSHGHFAALYTLVEGNGPCAEIPGDVIGVQTYYAQGEDGLKLDHTQPSLSMVTSSLGNIAFGREDQTVLPSQGAFSEPFASETDFCYVPELSVSAFDLPELEPVVDEETGEVLDPGAPATSVSYTWSDVRLFVREDSPGGQIAARLDYEEDGCQATYHVVGVNPAVFCGDDDGLPDDTQCAATPDPDNGRPLGSGINPEFETYCDPVLLLCMIPRNPPALIGDAN